MAGEDESHGGKARPMPDVARGAGEGRGRMTGRRVLVIGAGQNELGVEDAPVGNGRAISVLCGREGAAVCAVDIDAAAAGRTAEAVRAEGAEATALTADASDPAQLEQAFGDAAEAMGGIDGVVLNVGTGAGLGIAGTSPEDWDAVMAVNVRSAFLGCKYGLAAMAGGGSIVITGSIASHEVLPIPSYGASKAALGSLCRQAAVEGAPAVRVNLIEPGLIDTALGRLASQINPARDKVRIPLRRQGTAWETANAMLFLLSEEASYVTGQTLVVDGGLTVGPRA